jgi:hypothetical protein
MKNTLFYLLRNRLSEVDLEEPVIRFELMTNGLQNRCSTTELNRHKGLLPDGENGSRLIPGSEKRKSKGESRAL